jgi:transcriptional regulator with XRE-family HTH domain
MTTTQPQPRPGELLRQWRERRRLSQLDLALAAETSARHLSFVETGRARPSRDMLLRLAEQLEVPLRERNHLLLAGGYAPVFGQAPLDAPQMAAVREALGKVLAGHEPYPAVVVDRSWNLVDANAAVAVLLGPADPALLAPPANVLRVSLHPDGMAPRIVNLGEWRAHLLGRLRRQVALTGDAGLAELLDELRAYPCDQPEPEVEVPGPGDVVVPLRLRHGDQELSFLSIMASFGTPLDVTVAELAIESFFPADPATGAALRDLQTDQGQSVGGAGPGRGGSP